MIHAPFNFVPLSDNVYFPSWADQISQDIPFFDGISGTIELTLTAKTPIFVRNGHTKTDAETPDIYNSFSKNPAGRYFIPATSIKGCIRNVMEIMSFGKMSFVANKSFGLRDLDNQTYRDTMKDIHCGWLQFKDGKYIIADWGTPKRISLEKIADEYKMPELYTFIKDAQAFSKNNVVDCTSVKYKYDLIKKRFKDIDIASMKSNFSPDEELNKAMHEKNRVDSRVFYKFGGNEEGYLVLTGQPGIREQKLIDSKDKDKKFKWVGKLYEFIFITPKKENIKDVPDKVIEDFKFINENSPAYIDVWKSHLAAGKRIPVFIKLDSTGNPLSIGLSYMYKYPYTKRVHDAIPSDMLNSKEKELKKDLADCIFGYTFGDKALKGRVQWGHANANGSPIPLSSQKMITLSPHASYYQIYEENGRDWNFASRISGWKRYIVRENARYNVSDNDNNNNKSTSTKIEKSACFLPKGTSFKETIYFNNLRPIELGALLSAITFHGNQDKCFHNLGLGKAFGYGKIQVANPVISVMGNDGTLTPKNPYSYMKDFEKAMNEDCGVQWTETSQIRELLGMAHGIGDNDTSFGYMSLEEYKNNRNCRFERFTKIKGQTIQANDIEKKSEELEIEIAEKIKQEEEIRKQKMFTPTTLKIGDKVKARCFADKKVHIGDNEYDISLIVGKWSGIKSADLIDETKEIDVIIKQVSKAGKIIQVEYVVK